VAAPTSIGTLTLAGGAAILSGDSGAGLGYVTHGGPWAKGDGLARPIVAVVSQDSKGAVWLLHRRHGARVRGATALDAAPPGAYVRGAVSTGTATITGFEGFFPPGTTDDDRFVLVRAGDGPPSLRIVGRAQREGDGRAGLVRSGEAGGEVAAVRVTANAPEIDAADLKVHIADTCPQEAADALREGVKSAALGPISWTPGGVTVRCEEGGYVLASGARLLRTPFWAPRQLAVKSSADAVAVLASVRGQLDRALLSLEPDADPRVRAALALEASWLLDVPAVLGDVASPEAQLLRAGASYTLGDHDAALAALDGAGWEGATGEVSWRRHLARSATLLAKGDSRAAVTTLTAAADAETDATHKRSLMLGLAEVHLATGNFERFAVTLAASRGDSGAQSPEPTPSQEALTSRYTGLVFQSQGRIDDAIALYTSAAETYATSGDQRQAAQALLRIAELKVIAQRDATAEVSEARQLAIRSHDNELLGQVLLDDLTRFAEKNAAVDAPAGGREKLEAAVAANLRADRLDRVAVARRYGLLLLPAAADLSSKKGAVKSALEAALAAPDIQEATLLLSLLAQLEAAGFSFDAANRDIDLAISFAEALGDADLVELLAAEKATFQ
jgi:hypothetical protein